MTFKKLQEKRNLIQMAFRLANVKDEDFENFYWDLVRERKLMKTVRGLNELIELPEYRLVSTRALKRLGLEVNG